MNCKNCQSKLIENAEFCSHCGQSTTSFNQPFSDVAKNMAHELLDIDGRLSLTLRTMLTKPGKLTAEFNQGKRVKYTPPLRLYLAISIIFFVFLAKIYPLYYPKSLLTDSMLSYYSKAMFVLFPLFALIVQVFFRQSYYIGNLVFSMHLHSIVYIALMIIVPLEVLETNHLVFIFLQVPPSLYVIWYISVAFKTVYQQSWLNTLVKGFLIYFIYMALLGIVFDVLIENLL